MIDADDADPDDTVYVKCRRKNGQNLEAYAYHDDRNCRRFETTEHTKEYSRAAAQRQWKHPCLGCVLTDYSRQDFPE